MDLSNKAFFDMLSAIEPTPFAGPDGTSGVAEMESIPLVVASHGRNESVHGLFNAVSDIFQHYDEVTNVSAIASGSLEPQSWHMHVIPNVPNRVTSSHAASSSLAGKIQEHREEIKPGNMDFGGKITRDDHSPLPGIAVDQSGRWQERFQDLCKFRKDYGHCCVPSHWPLNSALAQWVKRQRYQYKLKKEGKDSRTMTDDRKKALDQLNFVWDPHSAFWEERLNKLHAFQDKHGHCNVPTRYPENPQLAVWVKCQRRQFKLYCSEGANRSNMTLERIAKLARVGFVFDPQDVKRKSLAKNAPTSI
jgi:hypothetical protein